MKITVDDLALFGSKPTFEVKLTVGQFNQPDWERVEAEFRGIFKRRYYTNHGPLLEELERELAEFLSVRHAICITNETIGLMIAAKAMRLKGKVITPSFSLASTVHSLTWAGLEPIFCDVDSGNHIINAEKISILIDEHVSAILGIHLWGKPCIPHALEILAREGGLHLYFDATHAFGCTSDNVSIGNFGEVEVFSFRETEILNASEGGCVCTNDDELAARIRNIRSSYGAGRTVSIPLTGNGRMSEAQAAMALMSLQDYPENRRRNQSFMALYTELLGSLPGIKLPASIAGNINNYQCVYFELDEDSFGLTKDQLIRVLDAENLSCRAYFPAGLHRTQYYSMRYPQFKEALPVTDQLCNKVVQLPSGQNLNEDRIREACQLITFVHSNASEITNRIQYK